MQKWGNETVRASDAYFRELWRLQKTDEFRDVDLSELLPDESGKTAIDTVRWLAYVFVDGGARGNTIEIIRRMEAAGRPASNAAKVRHAEEVVRYHADRFYEAFKVEPEQWKGNSLEEIAHQLAVTLWSEVDAAFGALDRKLDDVQALLRRYRRGRDRRLGASGLLVELNTLAGSPLGAYSFTPASIKSAKRAGKKPR